ncbi:MAG TPA: hypothetical protein VHN37_15930 [Actinomycetota bacterium]|nr:hypothetical protein [Actinomycetota bacterium]
MADAHRDRGPHMKKLIVTGVVAALVAGALVAPAAAGKKKKPKPRVAEAAYENPAVGIPGVVGSPAAGGAFEFPSMSNENYISVEITDDGGGSVTFTMSQDSDPDNTGYEIMGTWCGATEEPVQIVPGLPVRVSVYTTPGPDQPSCTGPATSGNIKATFTR